MKKIINITTVLVFIFFQNLNCQSNHLEILMNTISSLLNQRPDGNFTLGNYMLDSFIEIDSVGNNKATDLTDYGVINPYNTLDNCVLFTAIDTSGNPINWTNHFGIYRNEQIIWLSEGIEDCSWRRFVGVRDINNDGLVDIITACNSGITGNYEQIWIYSWNGIIGTVVNQVDEGGYSLITLLNRSCKIMDLNGDGLFEILGNDEFYNEEDERLITTEVFSWNGNRYGIWPNTPTYEPDTYSAANYFVANVFIEVSKQQDSLVYKYRISNSYESAQKIKYFFLTTKIKKADFLYSAPLGWDFFTEIAPLVYFEAINKSAQIATNTSLPGFYLKTNALPTINAIYLQAEHLKPDYSVEEFTLHYPEYLNNIYTNSIIIISICPEIPVLPFIPINFLDTLLNYRNRSFELDWIKNQTTSDKYDSLLNLAKTQLQQNNNSAAKSTLQIVLQEVDIDSTDNLTSEAYALLRYNTAYLIEKIPLQLQLNLNEITPAMSIKSHPGAFTMELTGSGFSSSSVVYFNSNARTTTYVSDSTITAAMLATDVTTVGNLPVWVSDGTTNSDTLVFKVVNNLPNEILPIMNCVTNNGNGTYTAYFGYNNKNSVSVFVPVYAQNKISPDPWDRGQPGVFKVGVQEGVFSVTWSSGNIIWHLNNKIATAKVSSPPCP
jgi:hypothetical protein